MSGCDVDAKKLIVRELKEVPCKNCDTPLNICMSDCVFTLNRIPDFVFQNFESPPFKNQFFHVFLGKNAVMVKLVKSVSPNFR